jgi:hypothetical protein
MIEQIRYLGIAGFLAFASAGFSQYTMDLTGVGNGANADGVYVSPYQGSIWNGAYTGGGAPTTNPLYNNGYVICDDFSDESYVGDVWNATATNAATLNGNELFTTSQTAYSVQDNYDAVAWLANQLIADVNNSQLTQTQLYTDQTNISFAIWDIMDGANTDPIGAGTVSTLIGDAFSEVVNGHYVGSNVTVFTPYENLGVGNNLSQEFLVVGGGPNGGPLVPTPEPASAAVLGFDLLSALGIVFLVRRYRARA